MTAVVDWGANFAITPLMHAYCGLSADMLVLSGLTVLTVILVNLFMSETRGLFVEAVSVLVEEKSQQSRNHE